MIKEYYIKNRKDVPNAKNLGIWIKREDEIPEFTQKTGKNKLVVRVMFQDDNGNFIYKDSTKTSFYGLTVIVDEIDEELKNLVGDNYKATI
jgi:hypothetical protein